MSGEKTIHFLQENLMKEHRGEDWQVTTACWIKRNPENLSQPAKDMAKRVDIKERELKGNIKALIQLESAPSPYSGRQEGLKHGSMEIKNEVFIDHNIFDFIICQSTAVRLRVSES